MENINIWDTPSRLFTLVFYNEFNNNLPKYVSSAI